MYKFIYLYKWIVFEHTPIIILIHLLSRKIYIRIPVLLSFYHFPREFLTFSISCWPFLYRISREKLEPEPGLEPRTSGFLNRRSTTWAILILMPAHVQIALLGRMPLLPGDAVMALSAIILTFSSSLLFW